MKNSKEYSAKVKKFYRSLKQEYDRVAKVEYADPLDSLVYAILHEHMSDSVADAAMKKLRDYFVDWNDLRVAQKDEVTEVLGLATEADKRIAETLHCVLTAVFAKYNMMNLNALSKLGKRPAKQILEKLSGISSFVVNYVFMTFLKGHAIPLNEQMIDYLRSKGLVYSKAVADDIGGFLSRQVSASNGYEFYSLLRKASDNYKPAAKKVVKHRKVTKKVRKKSAKKTVKKKSVRKKKKKSKKR